MPLEFDNRPPKKDFGFIAWIVTVLVLSLVSFRAFQYVQDHNRPEATLIQAPNNAAVAETPNPVRSDQAALVTPETPPSAAQPETPRVSAPRPPSKSFLAQMEGELEEASEPKHRMSKAEALVKSSTAN